MTTLNMNRRTFLKTTAYVGSSLSLGLSLTGCDENSGSSSGDTNSIRFAVISDPHIYDESLGTEGSAFEEYLESDRKMLVESVEILETIVAELQQESDLDMLIIPGDLTKDGELVCHERIIETLQPLRDRGIKVYVVPGNHDINNPASVSFDGDTTTTVDNISAETFASLYADFGYDDALYKDENSLSYIVEPVDGVWLVALDSCKYDDNDSLEHSETSGELSDELLSWLLPLLTEAQAAGKVVIGMMHHGIVAHFDSQPSVFAEYLIDNYESVGEQLAEYGLNLIFTGHFHAQDVASADYLGDGSLMMYDVETGSTVTYPCPYRLVELDITNGTLDISSQFVESLDSVDDFTSYAETFVTEGMESLYTEYLAGYGVDDDTISYIAPIAAALHVAHYVGDEATSDETMEVLNNLMSSDDATTAWLGSALYSIAVDPGLADNQLSLSISGESIAKLNTIQRFLQRKSAAIA